MFAGDPDTAARFHAGSSLEVPDYYDFLGRAPFTLEGWFRPTAIDVDEYRRLLNKTQGTGTPDSQGYAIIVETNLGLTFRRIRDGDRATVTVPSPPINTFSYLVATYDGASICLVLNAGQPECRSSTQDLTDNTAPFQVGTMGGYLGDIDEVAIYDYALPADRILAHYLAGLAP